MRCKNYRQGQVSRLRGRRSANGGTTLRTQALPPPFEAPCGRPHSEFWLGRPRLSRRLNHAPHPEIALAIDLDAVDFALEARKLLAEFLQRKQEPDRWTVGVTQAFAGHPNWNPWRIRNEHDGRNSTSHLGQLHLFSAVPNQLLIRLRGSQKRFRLDVASLL